MAPEVFSLGVALLIRPVVAKLWMVCFLVPVRKAVERWLPDGRLKCLLLRKV